MGRPEGSGGRTDTVLGSKTHGTMGGIGGQWPASRVRGKKYPTPENSNVVSDANPKGTITNSDLKLAGLVLLWLMMEHVCGPLSEKCIALFSDNSPTVS